MYRREVEVLVVADMIQMGFPSNIGRGDLVYKVGADLICAKCARRLSEDDELEELENVYENDTDYDCDWCGRTIFGQEEDETF